MMLNDIRPRIWKPRKYYRNVKNLCKQRTVSAPSHKNIFLTIEIKNLVKWDIKIFWSYLLLVFLFLLFPKCFTNDLLKKQDFAHKLSQSLSNTYVFQFFATSNQFLQHLRQGIDKLWLSFTINSFSDHCFLNFVKVHVWYEKTESCGCWCFFLYSSVLNPKK